MIGVKESAAAEGVEVERFARVGTEDPMSTLCRMVVNLEFEDLPEDVVDVAKRLILDAIGITIGGSSWEGIDTVVGLMTEQGGREECPIPLYGQRVPASSAAFAIGAMSRAMDMGDVHDQGGHSSEYNLPALLAATSLLDNVSGKDFLTAFVAGQEMIVRTGASYGFQDRAVLEEGTHGGHFIFGPIAAVGKLIGLTYDEMVNAEGIGRCLTQGDDLSMYHPATLMVRMHHGFIARDAITACLLAQRGIDGPREEVLLGREGFLARFDPQGVDEQVLTERLGERWMFASTSFKPYASCKANHSAVTGILEQMAVGEFGFEDIAGIHIEEDAMNWSQVCVPHDLKWNPMSVPQCQFSLPYAVASAARYGDLFFDSYAPEAMQRADVRELMTRITAAENRSLQQWGANLTTTLKDGRRYEGEYTSVKGSPDNPMTLDELKVKFHKCASYGASPIDAGRLDELIESVVQLEHVDDVSKALVEALVPVHPMTAGQAG